MTELTSHLFLGTQKDASRIDLIQQNGITHLLSVAGAFEPPNEINVECLEISLTVHGSSNLEIIIRNCFDFIEKAKNEKGKTLLFCQFAQNRSPTIAISYLMISEGWSLKKAHDFVLNKKGDIAPHQYYINQLRDLELALHTPPAR